MQYNGLRGDTMSTFAKRLREERTKAKLTQQEMADQLNISRGAYAQYENDMTQPSIETLVKIANVLKTSTDYLTGRY